MFSKQRLSHWWQARERRERKTLTLAGAVLLGLILYSLVWQPYWQSRQQLQQTYHANQHLLRWLTVQEKTIAQLQQTVAKRERLQGSGALLAAADTSLREAHLEAYHPQLKQDETGTLTISFDKVSFDYLIQWLLKFSQHHAISINQLNLNRLGKAPGMVAAVLVLTAGE